MAARYGLEGRTAIVTGAAHGIGRAIAARLAQEGCRVGIFDLDRTAAESSAAAIGQAAFASGDVSSSRDVDAGMSALLDQLGGCDILVNNAGICPVGKILDTSEDTWRKTFGVNVDGMFHVIRRVVPGMVERGSGAVINIASWMGKSGVPAYGAYCASKFAVVSLTQSLACEIGENGVRVNAVAPGLIVQTKMREESEIGRRAQGLPTPDERAKSIPMRRPGYPDDIAKAVAFLASDEASYITGETISVTGGSWND